MLSNIQVLGEEDRARVASYCKNRSFQRNSVKGETPRVAQSWARIILASPEGLAFPGVGQTTIKLFCLSQRKADIPDFTKHVLAKSCQAQNRPQLTMGQEDLRRLISYAYPGKIKEQTAMIKRAVIMTPSGQTVIPEQALWSVQSARNAFRVDLLTQIHWLRGALLSRW